MTARTLILIYICSFSFLSCKHTVEPVVLNPTNILEDVTLVTNADVTERSYKFSNLPLMFVFSDTTVPYMIYGSTRKKISDIYFTREMATQNAKNLAGNYNIDRDNFMDEPTRNTLTEATQITVGGRHYVLCIFDKQRFNIGPLEPNYSYLLDVTDEDNITAIAFTNLAEEGKYMPKIYGKNGKIAVEVTYYSRLTADDYTTETAVVTQDGSGNWVME